MSGAMLPFGSRGAPSKWGEHGWCGLVPPPAVIELLASRYASPADYEGFVDSILGLTRAFGDRVELQDVLGITRCGGFVPYSECFDIVTDGESAFFVPIEEMARPWTLDQAPDDFARVAAALLLWRVAPWVDTATVAADGLLLSARDPDSGIKVQFGHSTGDAPTLWLIGGTEPIELDLTPDTLRSVQQRVDEQLCLRAGVGLVHELSVALRLTSSAISGHLSGLAALPEAIEFYAAASALDAARAATRCALGQHLSLVDGAQVVRLMRATTVRVLSAGRRVKGLLSHRGIAAAEAMEVLAADVVDRCSDLGTSLDRLISVDLACGLSGGAR